MTTTPIDICIALFCTFVAAIAWYAKGDRTPVHAAGLALTMLSCAAIELHADRAFRALGATGIAALTADLVGRALGRRRRWRRHQEKEKRDESDEG